MEDYFTQSDLEFALDTRFDGTPESVLAVLIVARTTTWL